MSRARSDDFEYGVFPVKKSDGVGMKDEGVGPGIVDNHDAYHALYPTMRRVMVEEGVYMHRHYAASVCTPSRKQLLTGRSVATQGNGEWNGVRPRYSLLSDKLKQAGYKTKMLGKCALHRLDTLAKGGWSRLLTPTARVLFPRRPPR